jgi:glucokinase
VAADALVRDAKRIMKRKRGKVLAKSLDRKLVPLTPEIIARAARKGDRVAVDVFDNAAQHLGMAIASLVNVLNPDVIGVVGGVANGFDLMKKRVYKEVSERAFSQSAGTVTIVKGKLGFNAAAVGAALMARDARQTDPARSPRRRKGI